MATDQTKQIREERWREKYKNDGSTARMNKTGDKNKNIWTI
jgi:hypothetical protein